MDEAGKRQLYSPCCVWNHPHTPHVHTHSEPDYRPSWTFSFSWPLSCNCLSPPTKTHHLLSSVCLLILLLVCGADNSEMVRSRSGAHNTRKSVQRVRRQAYFRATDFCPPDAPPPSASNQGSQSTNCSVSLSVHASVCIGLDQFSNLPVCFSVFFLSLSFSLCRFTLTYRELILLFLFFNKLLCKR